MRQLEIEMKAIILVAGIGKRLRSVYRNPKCLLKINGVTLLGKYLKYLKKIHVKDVVLVVGYKKERIIEFARDFDFQGNIKFIENPDFAEGSILSLYRAKNELNGNVLLMDGDVYFEKEILNRLVNDPRHCLLPIDTTSSSSGEEMMVGVKNGRILNMARELSGNFDLTGEAIGFYKFDNGACEELKRILEENIKLGKYKIGYEEILPFLFQKIYFHPFIIGGLKWIEIDFKKDIHKAEKLAKD